MGNELHTSDYLVIGSGIAGLSFAINASQYGSVIIVTKKRGSISNTHYAQGGIASVLDDEDSIERHIADTHTAGDTHCNRKAVEILVKNGPDRIQDLIDWGVQFSSVKDDKGNSRLALGREGGHSKNRIVHTKDYTGKELNRALLEKIATIDTITVFEDFTAVDLLTEHQLYPHRSRNSVNSSDRRCYGAYVLDNESGEVHRFLSTVTLIASGGVGGVYEHTTNPSIATGDGIAMAFRAGAEVADMEFMQFHPTTLYEKESNSEKTLLISEAVRGEGAHLVNRRGERFMKNLHPLGELAPRDIVARAIDKELKKSGESSVFLDITFKEDEFITKRFPNIYKKCLDRGIDITKELIPVVPAAHYLCGGVVSDLDGKTSIKNLYVAGESACTGVHGANRLASNSLLEALVFSRRAVDHSQSIVASHTTAFPDFPLWNKEGTFDLEEWILICHNVDEIRTTMWDYVGIVRTDLRLERALRRILFLEKEINDYYKRRTVWRRLLELRNLAIVSRMIISGASFRKESRGLHYTTNYPQRKEEFASTVVQYRFKDSELRDISDISFNW